MEIELGTEVEEKQSYSPHSTETGGEWPLQGRGAHGPQGRTGRVRGLEAGETPHAPRGNGKYCGPARRAAAQTREDGQRWS